MLALLCVSAVALDIPAFVLQAESPAAREQLLAEWRYQRDRIVRFDERGEMMPRVHSAAAAELEAPSSRDRVRVVHCTRHVLRRYRV